MGLAGSGVPQNLRPACAITVGGGRVTTPAVVAGRPPGNKPTAPIVDGITEGGTGGLTMLNPLGIVGAGLSRGSGAVAADLPNPNDLGAGGGAVAAVFPNPCGCTFEGTVNL